MIYLKYKLELLTQQNLCSIAVHGISKKPVDDNIVQEFKFLFPNSTVSLVQSRQAVPPCDLAVFAIEGGLRSFFKSHSKMLLNAGRTCRKAIILYRVNERVVEVIPPKKIMASCARHLLAAGLAVAARRLRYRSVWLS